MAGNETIIQLPAQVGSADTTSIFYAVGTSGTQDTQLSLPVLVNNLGLTGVPTAPTASTPTNTTQIASTAYVQNQGYLTSALATSTYAPLNSPVFVGPITGGSASINLGGVAGFASIQSTPIGTTSAAAGGFTTLTNSGAFTVNGSISGPGITTLLNPYALLASPTFTGTLTAAAATFTGLVTPSTTIGIKGTTLADNANTGSIGEYVTATGTTVPLTNNTAVNITSISLTAGDWDVSGVIAYNPAGTTQYTVLLSSISTTSATNGPLGQATLFELAFATGAGSTTTTPVVRVNISTTTTVFLVAQAGFTVSTMTGSGVIRARRVR